MHQFRRRHVLAAGLALTAVAVVPAFAADDATSRAVGWLIGDNLSLGSLVYAQGADPKDVATYLDKAKGLGANVGIVLPDLPVKGADETATLTDVIHYLIAGDGWKLGDTVTQNLGKPAAILFEVAIKSNLLLVLYEPGDDHGIGNIITARLDGLLPRELWGPAVDAITAKASADDVSTAVVTMHTDISNFLLKAMG